MAFYKKFSSDKGNRHGRSFQGQKQRSGRHGEQRYSDTKTGPQREEYQYPARQNDGHSSYGQGKPGRRPQNEGLQDSGYGRGRGKGKAFSKPGAQRNFRPFSPSGKASFNKERHTDNRTRYSGQGSIDSTAQRSRPFQEAPSIDGPALYDVPENLLSGRNPIREALKAGRDIEKLMVAEGDLSGSAREIVFMAKNAGIIVQTVERSRLDQITRNHQGMIAFASAFAYSTVDDILNTAKERNEAPFIIILDRITDPMNLGAIIRSAACVGAHGIIVQQHRAVGLTPSAVRASAGAVEHVKVARVTNINQVIRDLKNRDVWVYAADTDGEDHRKVDFSGACALVIGSEGEGVSQLTLNLCDKIVSIPMSGLIDSFNASVAAGILMYSVFSARVP